MYTNKLYFFIIDLFQFAGSIVTYAVVVIQFKPSSSDGGTTVINQLPANYTV